MANIYLIAFSVLATDDSVLRLLDRDTTPCATLDDFLESRNDKAVGDSMAGHASELDILPEFGGRLCYDSFSTPRPGGNSEYIKHILKSGHGSVLEHTNVTILFEGVSRTLTHELVRHRAGYSYSQRSQRYCDEVDNPHTLHVDILDCPEATELMNVNIKIAQANYKKLVAVLDNHFTQKNANLDKTSRRKRVRGAARGALLSCVSTDILVTANLRAWRNFLEQRANKWADLEIVEAAVSVARILKAISPSCFQDFEINTVDDGIGGEMFITENLYKKV